MKTLIAYSTESGTTKGLSELLSKKIKGDVTIINLKEQRNITLSNFETIIIGGSIKGGKMQNEVRSFCINNLNELKQKNVGLFICCGSEDKSIDYMKSSFTAELFENAISKEYFGFEMNPDNIKPFDKIMLKIGAFLTGRSRKPQHIKKIREDNIEKMSSIINNIKS